MIATKPVDILFEQMIDKNKIVQSNIYDKVIGLVYQCNKQNKQWLPIVTYNWINSGRSGSRELVLNQMFEKGNKK